MTSPITRMTAGLIAAATVIALSGCSTGAREDRGAADAPPTSAEAATGRNTDDVMFAQLMIPHHQQAVELAALVPDRSTDPELIRLAATIAGQQQPEITAMKAMLAQWEVESSETPHQGAHGMTMAGMVDEATMVRLEALKGPEFDTLWLRSMIAHHQGAIEMANVEITDGSNVDMVGLARAIVSAQQREIDQMTQMLAGMEG
ncbi:MAG: DUF305 domain-containing protein [Mycobacterium sp.]|nr:DUF305 domain-containing protein [Actinomycetota bacterium]